MRILSPASLHTPRGSLRGQTGPRVLLALVVVAALAGAVAWYWHTAGDRDPADGSAAHEVPQLSESTRQVLDRIESPVEVRFYSVLDPATVPDTLQAFAGRVEQLLAQYQRSAEGGIDLTRYDSTSDANRASADGIKPFNLEKGDACFLGIALRRGERSETLPQLSPHWEAALEADLSRAIARLIEPVPAPRTPSLPDRNAIMDVRRSIPDVTAVSLDQGKQLLRDAAQRDFRAAAGEWEARIREAEQQVIEAQGTQSKAEQQAALDRLQQLQTERNRTLTQVAARLQEQIGALEQMKGASR